MNSDLAVRANIRLQIQDAATGRTKRWLRGHNMVTDAGLAALALGLAGTNPAITEFGFGDDNTAADASDTALGNEVDRFPITAVSGAGAVATAQHYLGSGQLNGENLVEAGLFIGNTLLARFVFNDPDLQPKDNTVAVTSTWTLTFARA